jgi:hypothetical protein
VDHVLHPDPDCIEAVNEAAIAAWTADKAKVAIVELVEVDEPFYVRIISVSVLLPQRWCVLATVLRWLLFHVCLLAVLFPDCNAVKWGSVLPSG